MDAIIDKGSLKYKPESKKDGMKKKKSSSSGYIKFNMKQMKQ
jgi:hypothetical protein